MRTITFIFAVLLVGLKAISAQSNDTEWKRTLKSDLIQYIAPGSYPPGETFGAGNLYILVPVKISKELESHPKEEMLSYLKELQDESPKDNLKTIILGDWILIISNGLQGSPTTVTSSHDSITEKLPYVGYSYPAFSQTHK